MYKMILLSLLLGIAYNAMSQYNDQSAMVSAGDYYEGSNISLSWSLGEIATETLIGSNLVLTQGIQQSFFEPIGIKDHANFEDKPFTVFPNPTFGEIHIMINQNDGPKTLPNAYELYDIQGKKILLGKITVEMSTINIASYKEAIYYLRLFNTDANFSTTIIVQKINK